MKIGKQTEETAYRISEVADKLKVNRSTVLRWIEKGYLTSVQYPSGIHRIPEEALDRFLDQMKKNGNGHKSYKVLVIDDERVILALLEDMLNASGLDLNVRTSTDSFDALLAVGSFKPDILIIDFDLQEMNGLQLAQKIRSHRDYARIPIILISGVLGTPPDSEAQVDAFLKKPFTMEEIEATMRLCLKVPAA